MSTTTILVVGATGRQGSSVLTELANLQSSSSEPKPKIKVLALTRSASSAKAQALASQHPSLDLTVVEGDSRQPKPIFAAHPGIDAVFSYTTPPDEEPQAMALVDAAAAHAARGGGTGSVHFVFSSVDRGGEPASWDNPTDVEHFLQKHHVEVHLRDACRRSKGAMTYTILRPVAFMDNLNPGTFGTVFAALWNTMPASRKLQVVSVRDIGLFGAQALLDPGAPAHRDRAFGLAGDELTLGEARDIFRRVSCGRELSQAWFPVGWVVRNVIAGRHVGAMFAWFERTGYGVDIAALRQREPRLQSFETWLHESSAFELPEPLRIKPAMT
ncbi:NAD(P)-binding protein [Hypoxylon sp. FL1284]|nr:NAD(P)-binding protein [Hypoxylon sp. FL1284]